MKYIYSIAVSLSIFFFSCQKSHKPPVPATPEPQKMALVIGNPVSYGEQDLLVFPIGANYNPEIEEGENLKVEAKESRDLSSANTNTLDKNKGSFTVQENQAIMYDMHASREYRNSNESDFDMRNILFYNKTNGESYVLSSDTLHILSFAIHREFKIPLIFYRVVKIDINQDKKYNSEDAVMLYVSNIVGKNFIQVTPENEQFFDYFYYPESQLILIKTALDIDQNKQFTAFDETIFREMRLQTPAFGKEIFTSEMKENLKKQISVFK